MEYKPLEDGSICYNATKFKMCPSVEVPSSDVEESSAESNPSVEVPSSDVEKSSSAESKNGLFGIVAILILSFIL